MQFKSGRRQLLRLILSRLSFSDEFCLIENPLRIRNRSTHEYSQFIGVRESYGKMKNNSKFVKPRVLRRRAYVRGWQQKRVFAEVSNKVRN